ncbi:MAG: sugar phosphate isomerase/epimerase [Thermoplasmata archaeon YP2-bin.285]|uniref:Sugar phosphate isomerase/epimerase n=1 Tax=Candidatus Sysuiplasma superficiale TaxID=2823368 RepID=A0A8J8CC90_9ARCH|nr:sugar phosphate isomerase/epimerase [Candidatus Sysuiplasma superficiale]
MKLHLSSLSLCLKGFEENIEEVASNFEGWQLVAEGRHSPEMVSDVFEDLSGSYDLQYTVHLPMDDINLASLNRSIRTASINECARAISTFSLLGVTTFVLHPGNYSLLSFQERERAIVLSREAIISLSSYAASHNSTLLVENLPSDTFALGSRYSEMRKIIDGTRAGLCLDISHALLEGELSAFLAARDSIKMLHISDNDGKSDCHLPIGRGVSDHSAILRNLHTMNCPLVIEARNLPEAIEGKNYLTRILGSFV